MVSHGVIGKPNPKPFGLHKHGRRNHRHQPGCSGAVGSILTSLNMSIFTFHNRLLRCVSRLFRLSTTTKSTRSHRVTTKQSYKKLKGHEQQPLLKQRNDKKRTIFLDLDETLVHATMKPPTGVKVDFMVRIKSDGVVIPMYVVKRPGVSEFLDRLGKNYRVGVFTAGVPEYASAILDKLDKNRVISQRLYRGSCTEMKGRYVKDLALVAKDLGSVLIVDDNPVSYMFQPDNAVPIKPFVDDMEDRELLKLADFFDRCYQYEDLRDAAAELLSNKQI